MVIDDRRSTVDDIESMLLRLWVRRAAAPGRWLPVSVHPTGARAPHVRNVCALVFSVPLQHSCGALAGISGCSGPSGLKFPHNDIFSMSQASSRPEDLERGLDTGMLATP